VDNRPRKVIEIQLLHQNFSNMISSLSYDLFFNTHKERLFLCIDITRPRTSYAHAGHL
jgi:hypothetical protein